MLREYHEKAYAKVNFNLRVLPRRADGFHDIESIFQTVSLFDELVVTEQQEKTCTVVCDSMNLPTENTLTLAYKAFCEVVDFDVPGVIVRIKKGIPSGGGLGGGSADAAALVRVLEKICNLELSDLQRDLIAEKTGSDVFFFMHCNSEGKGCALVSGRGECVKMIESRRDLVLLLIFPGVSSSTKDAYCLVDSFLQGENKVKYPDFGQLEAIYRKNPKEWMFINTFTCALCNKYDEIKSALNALKDAGADYYDMSGSGSTVFGVFTLEQQAMNISNLLCESWNCLLVQTL